jgi:3',5'-cyclic AMP phosphodiesterase CpdA
MKYKYIQIIKRLPFLYLLLWATACPTRADDEDGRWSVIVLPDTQGYTNTCPEVFIKQAEWIAHNRDARNIKFVLHEGDITNHNTHGEWLSARQAILHIRRAGIPVVMVPGNHDVHRVHKPGERYRLMNEHFSWGQFRLRGRSGVRESGHVENLWYDIDTPWGPFIIIGLEFFPGDEILDWANKTAARFPDHHAVLLTHAYLYHDDTRYDWPAKGKTQEAGVGAYAYAEKPGTGNDGEQMWRKLVSKHKNFRFVFSGHVLGDGTGYLVSKGEHGNEVHQMMINYQPGVEPNRGPGGGGFLRVLEFQPDGKTIKVSSYSPYLDQWLSEPDQRFTITLNEPFFGKQHNTGNK